ncbi:MAG: hypothetical protein ACYTDY_06845 [Planctomycetota bacterium]
MENRRRDRTLVRVDAVRKQLEHLAREGDLVMIAVQDETGLVLGEVNISEEELEWDLAAFHQVLAGFRSLLGTHMDLHLPEEVRVAGLDGHRLVCRYLAYGDEVLTVLAVARGRHPPADLLDRAVSGVRRILAAIDM